MQSFTQNRLAVGAVGGAGAALTSTPAPIGNRPLFSAPVVSTVEAAAKLLNTPIDETLGYAPGRLGSQAARAVRATSSPSTVRVASQPAAEVRPSTGMSVVVRGPAPG